jgi:hypothetical protein
MPGAAAMVLVGVDVVVGVGVGGRKMRDPVSATAASSTGSNGNRSYKVDFRAAVTATNSTCVWTG